MKIVENNVRLSTMHAPENDISKPFNAINTGGRGVFSTSSPVSGSELQNGKCYHLEIW